MESWNSPATEWLESDYDESMQLEVRRQNRLMARKAWEGDMGVRVQSMFEFKDDHEFTYDGVCYVCGNLWRALPRTTDR